LTLSLDKPQIESLTADVPAGVQGEVALKVEEQSERSALCRARHEVEEQQ